MTTDQTTNRIRDLNDALRTTLQGGKIMMTAGVSALGPLCIAALVQRLRAYDIFDEENDPHSEHDFGALDHHGQRFFWKIDYYYCHLLLYATCGRRLLAAKLQRSNVDGSAGSEVELTRIVSQIRVT